MCVNSLELKKRSITNDDKFNNNNKHYIYDIINSAQIGNDLKKLKDNCEFWKNAYFKIKGDI